MYNLTVFSSLYHEPKKNVVFHLKRRFALIFEPKYQLSGDLSSSFMGNPHMLFYKCKEVFFMDGVAAGVGYGGGFALVVILFILLIIVGAAYIGWC